MRNAYFRSHRRRGVVLLLGGGLVAGAALATSAVVGGAEVSTTLDGPVSSTISVLATPGGGAGSLDGLNGVGGKDGIDASSARVAYSDAEGTVFVGRNASGGVCVRYQTVRSFHQACGQEADLLRDLPSTFVTSGEAAGPPRLIGFVTDGFVSAQSPGGVRVPVANNVFVMDAAGGVPDITLATADGRTWSVSMAGYRRSPLG